MHDERRITGLAALAAAILFAAGNALWALDQPAQGAGAARILHFYTHASGRIVAGASISLVSFVPFTLFASGLRALLPERLFARTAFAGGLLTVAAGLGAETINMAAALRAGDHQLTPALGQALFDVSYVLGYSAAGIGIAIMLLAAGTRRRPSSIVLVIAGLAFLTPLSRYLLAPSVIVLAVVGILLTFGKRQG